ncbi:swr1-complex 5 protein [Rutstroemia sp. NJR-2017a WRK4]|nr:swr1-complex 5 protein [Rutstroemia sp. NJR-2017a WRK4]
MSTLLGKRKRASAAAISSNPSKVLKNKETKASKTKPISRLELEDQDEEASASEADSASDSAQTLDPQEIFRRHFEAQFKPLPVIAQNPPPANPDLESEEEDEDEDWDRLSESSAADEDNEERNNGVQVVEHVNIDARTVGMSKAELRAFMSSKPPSSLSHSLHTTQSSKSDPETTQSEALNLKNDLELQRLLSESHLLTSTSGSSTLPSLHGSNRIKALDLRIQALGAKSSIHVQEKMPMKMRKGIVKAAEEKAERRRREAKENGIVLERERRGGGKGKSGGVRRERGVGAPAVGRLVGGATLRLSKRDVEGIEGPKRGSRGGGRGGRGGGGRGKRR